ncbi:periaxin [Rhineura floridana]|uniref:periaxin n=1 Tax=Rhineura floridana TaxID=261503 RepID=UPI002AC8076F|nr:periaxin [Rhineura floridana]XP_061453833.1 periaxin [Rhineura floridana]
MQAQLSAMERTTETSEVLEIIVETEAEAGVSGMLVAAGGKGGLFVKDVLKDSPAARALSLREGDQLLSARVYFDNMKYEDALQILKCAEPYMVSFCLKRTVPSADVCRKPGAATSEVRGPKAKMAKLNIQSLVPLKKKKKQVAKGLAKGLQEAEVHGSGDPAARKLESAPVDVEFFLPKFSKLRKAKSAGEVAFAEPSPDISPHLSSLETKRHKLKFPRLKVKEAAAAAAAQAEGGKGRLGVGLPKTVVEMTAGGKGGAQGKGYRFTVPFSKVKRAKGGVGAKGGAGFQAPQVELDLPLPRVGPGGESPKASRKGEGFRIQAPQFGLPKVEAVLPQVSTVGLAVPEVGLQAGLKIPVAEVSAPEVDVDLGFPRVAGAAQEVAPKGQAFKIRVPKFGVSAEEAELTLPTPDLQVLLGKGRAKTEALEKQLKPGLTMLPSLEVGFPSVGLEIPLPKGNADVELPKPRVGVPDISVKMPLVSLPKLGSKAQEEGEGKLPHVELGSPKTKDKGPKIQIPGLGISLVEHTLESKEGATVAVESKAKLLDVKVPSLDISAPRVGDVQLPKPMVELAVRVKAEEAAEGPGFKFQMPQVSLPKLDLPAKAAYSPPQMPAKLPKTGGDTGVKVSVPKVDLSLPAVKLPDVRLPKVPVPKPELDISVEKPKVEVAGPVARLSFPSAAVPVLDIDLPKVGVELDLPKVESELVITEQPPRSHEVKLRVPTFETMSKDLEIEISVPKCQVDQPESSVRTLEGPDVSGMVAKIPKVDLSLGKELPAAEGERVGEIGLDLQGKPLPKIGLELEGPQMKLPLVEIPSVKLPDVAIESSKFLEAESKMKSPRFALPKFSISAPKAWKASPDPEASVPEARGPEAAEKGSKLKMPKFGISFPKSKWGLEVEGPKLALGVEGNAPKERAVAALEPDVRVGSPETRVQLPAVDVDIPVVDVDLGLPNRMAEWPSEEAAGALPEVGIGLPDVKVKVPKFSLPKFGGKDKEGGLEFESQEGKLRESREALAGDLGTKMPEKEAKVSKFKMPSFSIMRRDAQGTGPEVGAKGKQVPGSPKGKPQGPFAKMPKLRLTSPKVQVEKGEVMHARAPDLEVKIPQVELPKIGPKGARAEAGLVMGSDSPSLKVKMPLLEIAVPGTKPDGDLIVEKPVVDVSKADLRGCEGELKIPRVPSIGISAPKAELDVSLPAGSVKESTLHGATDAKVTLPLVELPKFGRGEEVEVQLLGGSRLSFGGEGEAEASILPPKIRVPKVDISLPKTRLSDVELPLTEEEVAAEGKFRMPSVGLLKFSTPKVKAPEVELDVSLEAGKVPRAKASAPSVRLPKFGGSSSYREGEAEMDLPRVLQLELKAPKLRESTEIPSPESGAKETKLKMPSLPITFGLGKAEAEARMGPDESKFKLKLPSLSLSKAGAESSTDTQPLCPPAEGVDVSFKMPQIALPDVGFSVDLDGKREAKGEAGSVAGLEMDVGGLEGRLKVPQIKMPVLEVLDPKGDTGAPVPASQGRRGSGGGEQEGKKMAFKMPGLEISAPGLGARADYEVEEAQLQPCDSQEPEGAGKSGGAGSEGCKGARAQGEALDANAGKKYKVKIPKFGLSLPRTGPEGGEGIAGHEAEAKVKRPVFGLGRPKGKGAEGSSGLLEGEEEPDGTQGLMAKLKLKPTFGLSLSKAGAEVNGELEESSSKLKVPKLGFSTAEGDATQANGERAEASLPNGAQDTKNKLGKIRLPQVELSSPSKTDEMDPELNLKLMRAEEAKEEGHGAGGGGGGGGSGSTSSTFAALKVAKFKSPKISFSGFKKRNGEGAPGAVVSSAARTEMASLEMGNVGTKGERSPKFKFPKLVLSPKSHGVLEITPEHRDDTGEGEGRLKVKLPSVGFSGELSSEGQILARGEAP